jgi:hypothetical protein
VIGFNGEVPSMLRHSADTNEALQRLDDLHRRSLRSRSLQVKQADTCPQPFSDESPPRPLTQKRNFDIDFSYSNCQRDAAVDLQLQPLPHGHSGVLSSRSIKKRIGRCGKKFVRI